MLQQKHGENWPQILMPDRAQKWSEKRDEDAAHGLPTHDLIHYSEFTELASMIEQRWNDGFAGRLTKASKVISRIFALAPHRNYEFHSRPMTPEQLIGIVYAARELEAFLLDDCEDTRSKKWTSADTTKNAKHHEDDQGTLEEESEEIFPSPLTDQQ